MSMLLVYQCVVSFIVYIYIVIVHTILIILVPLYLSIFVSINSFLI